MKNQRIFYLPGGSYDLYIKIPKPSLTRGNLLDYINSGLHSYERLRILPHLVPDYEDEDTRYPHRRKEGEEDTEPEHEPEPFDETDTEDIKDDRARERGDMAVPDS